MSRAPASVEVLFTPAELAMLERRDLSNTTCVVFDVLRATSTLVTALANGAEAIVPVAEIGEALELRAKHAEFLLAGEREGLRIRAELTGGIDFDFGNSPREFTPERVRGRTIVLTTTNGSRALRACAGAKAVLAGSWLNLRATAGWLKRHPTQEILLVCSGTGAQAAYEDALGAGALGTLIQAGLKVAASDSLAMAQQIYERHEKDLMSAVRYSRNGRRLLGMEELRDDVAWCLQRDCYSIVARMEGGKLRAV